MNIIHNHFGRGSSKNKRNDNDFHMRDGPKIDIKPGQVEEAVHYMAFNGAIDLSQLHFEAFPADGGDLDPSSALPSRSHTAHWDNESQQQHNNNNFNNSTTHVVRESFLDIAVFEVPERCTSRTCDLSRFGVGRIQQFSGATFLNLCHGGRLDLDLDVYRGYHTQLMVPQEGPMPQKVRYGKVTVPVPNRNYEVMIANCNDSGRKVQLTGQVIFDFDDDPVSQLDASSLAVLTLIAFAVCLFFSACSIRVRWGRGSGSDYMVVDDHDNTENDIAVNHVDGDNNSISYRDIPSHDDNERDGSTSSTDRNSSSYSDSNTIDYYPGDGIELAELDNNPNDDLSSDDEEGGHDLRLHTVPIV
jgi:hypothetical protein